MPYSIAHKADWTADQKVLAEIEGAATLTSWFGFLPSFHDATIEQLAFSGRDCMIAIMAFRMTSEVDDRGFYVLDRHARVTFHLSDVSGIVLDCQPNSIISELGLRRLAPEHVPVSNTAAIAGDYELAFDDVCGGSGSVCARGIRASLDAATS